MNFIAVILLCFVYAICNVSGAALIKLQLQESTLVSLRDYISFVFKPKVIVGFSVVFLSAMILIKALSLSKISLVNSISTGMNFSLTLAMGYIVFQDRLGLTHYAGIIIILIGVIVIALAERS